MSEEISGTIANTVAHLAYWCRVAPEGLACVSYLTESTKQETQKQLCHILNEKNILYSEIELPKFPSTNELVGWLKSHLKTLTPSVVSLQGFASTLSNESSLENQLRVINAHRENLALYPLRQIWWLPQYIADAFLHFAPDFYSWFIVKLEITEIVYPSRLSPNVPQSPAVDASVIKNAELRVAELLERATRAKEQGLKWQETVPLINTAITTLLAVSLIEKAEALFQEWLPPQLEWEIPNAQDLVNTLNNRAILYAIQGKDSLAEPLFQRASMILKHGKGTS